MPLGRGGVGPGAGGRSVLVLGSVGGGGTPRRPAVFLGGVSFWMMVVACLWSTRARAEPPDAQPRFDIHFQATVATQAHPGFGAAYSGPHSLKTDAESATSVVMDVFTAARLWRGAELYFNPALSGGRGLSKTLGVAAFPSGEVYRVGDPDPTIFLGRVFLRQVFG